MYECTICLTLNSASRQHCQYCGTIPAQYSVTGATSKLVNHDVPAHFISVVAAHGVERVGQWRQTRSNMKTVSADYYAESAE
jgi:hypothetical protein